MRRFLAISLAALALAWGHANAQSGFIAGLGVSMAGPELYVGVEDVFADFSIYGTVGTSFGFDLLRIGASLEYALPIDLGVAELSSYAGAGATLTFAAETALGWSIDLFGGLAYDLAAFVPNLSLFGEAGVAIRDPFGASGFIGRFGVLYAF
jgi:hypothetical protein